VFILLPGPKNGDHASSLAAPNGRLLSGPSACLDRLPPKPRLSVIANLDSQRRRIRERLQEFTFARARRPQMSSRTM